MGLFLETGERGLLAGQTGSGKTQDAIFQLRNAPVSPVIVFDTKIEDAFFSLPEGDETLDLVEGIEAFKKYQKQPRDKYADYVLVRPTVNEVQDFDILDEYCAVAYYGFGKCTLYYDELYNWHNRGVPVNNFVALLTRGRSKGKTVLQATQRPGWISRFCFTESNKFYIHRLIDQRDRITFNSMVPDFSTYPQPAKFGFYFYEVGESEFPQEYKPVPYTPTDKKRVFKRKWL